MTEIEESVSSLKERAKRKLERDLGPLIMDALAGGSAPRSLPEGVVRVSAVLPEHQAFIVKKWDEAARSKLRKPS